MSADTAHDFVRKPMGGTARQRLDARDQLRRQARRAAAVNISKVV